MLVSSLFCALDANETLQEEPPMSLKPATAVDICNFDLIYNDKYQYSLPKGILQSFLSGKSFGRTETYSATESWELNQEINEIYQRIVARNPMQTQEVTISAGAPGAGKTTWFRQDLEENYAKQRYFAYVCPDDVCLPSLSLYQNDIEKGENTRATREAAYTKARPASNAATHLILAHLILNKYSFYFGSTSTSPMTGKFFQFLKDNGCRIRLVHFTAPDDVRWKSIQERDKTFVQTTEEDIREKGLMLPQRIRDTYLAFADEIDFYYRGAVDEDAKLAARWTWNHKHTKNQAALEIVNEKLYENIKTIHNSMVKTLNRPDITWENTVEKSTEVPPREFTETKTKD